MIGEKLSFVCPLKAPFFFRSYWKDCRSLALVTLKHPIKVLFGFEYWMVLGYAFKRAVFMLSGDSNNQVSHLLLNERR